MTPVDWAVVAGGVVAIGLVIWWFFLAGDGSTVRHDHHSH